MSSCRRPLLRHSIPAAQQQEDLSQKIQPKANVLPKQPSGPATGQVVQFKIGEFTVIVASPAAPGAAKPAEPADRDQIVSPAVKDESGYSGQGHVVIRSKRVPVTFRGIAVTPAASGQVPVATAGTVTGTAGPAVEYQWDRFDVKLERPSIRLAPDRATAAAVVTLVQAPFMAAGGDSVLKRIPISGSSGDAGLEPVGRSMWVLTGDRGPIDDPGICVGVVAAGSARVTAGRRCPRSVDRLPGAAADLPGRSTS